MERDAVVEHLNGVLDDVNLEELRCHNVVCPVRHYLFLSLCEDRRRHIVVGIDERAAVPTHDTFELGHQFIVSVGTIVSTKSFRFFVGTEGER